MRPRQILFVLLSAVCAALVSGASHAQQKAVGQIATVIELYTSQGCSSCPAADSLLKSYVGRDDVLALSFNVDIWDSLGWKDTLAKPQYSQRQRSYARSRGDSNVYTPQTIVNGMAHEVGSDRGGIERSIKSTSLMRKAMHVDLTLRGDGDSLVIDIPKWGVVGASGAAATVWLVKLTPRVDVAIPKGENAGRTITYYNVVRDLRSLTTWTGEAKSTRVPREVITGCTPGTCAVMLQQGETGGILGAAWVPGISGT